MLWGHVASCRVTNQTTAVTNRPVLPRSSPSFVPNSRSGDLGFALEKRVLKKRGSTVPVVMGGPVWGGRQAAGKADSQAFSGKRLPHPWGGS